ncbi:MAG TPA: aromatic-ring-hydroxylating dioxygenase subunit beta [Polyangia bacterium]|nr:aromatic-ring-hydroxylating dioxygenase subunit beta [Polyangia bacterium]
MSDARVTVEETIYRAGLLLDAHDFEGFLALCAPEFRYAIEAYSPEIRRVMTWLDHDKDELAALFRTLSRHNSDHAPLSRHLTVYTVAFGAEGRQAEVVSALQVFRTTLDGGATALFAVGKIHDTVVIEGGQARLHRRTIKLDTRLLGIGSHIPF